jgi:hypothetical protein
LSTVAAAAAAAIAQAIKASGTIVRMRPGEFRKLVARQEQPLVVYTTGGMIRKNHQYLTGYRGLAFYTKSSTPVELPGSVEIVLAETIWIPG